jgi:hypothetical protein
VVATPWIIQAVLEQFAVTISQRLRAMTSPPSR